VAPDRELELQPIVRSASAERIVATDGIRLTKHVILIPPDAAVPGITVANASSRKAAAERPVDATTLARAGVRESRHELRLQSILRREKRVTLEDQ
jgi:hypothetical protein